MDGEQAIVRALILTGVWCLAKFNRAVYAKGIRQGYTLRVDKSFWRSAV